VAVVAGGRLVACAPPAELGGPLRDEAVVRWRDRDGLTREERTSTPTALLRRLLAEHAGGDDGVDELPGLVVERATLEDVYLRLVGSSAAADGDRVEVAA
jgi:ABC-2 type transport system ATP-binding protein